MPYPSVIFSNCRVCRPILDDCSWAPFPPATTQSFEVPINNRNVDMDSPRNLKLSYELVAFAWLGCAPLSKGEGKSTLEEGTLGNGPLLTSMEIRGGDFELNLRHWEIPTSIKTPTT